MNRTGEVVVISKGFGFPEHGHSEQLGVGVAVGEVDVMEVSWPRSAMVLETLEETCENMHTYPRRSQKGKNFGSCAVPGNLSSEKTPRVLIEESSAVTRFLNL